MALLAPLAPLQVLFKSQFQPQAKRTRYQTSKLSLLFSFTPDLCKVSLDEMPPGARRPPQGQQWQCLVNRLHRQLFAFASQQGKQEP